APGCGFTVGYSVTVNVSPSAFSAISRCSCLVPPTVIGPYVQSFLHASESIALPSSHCSATPRTPSPHNEHSTATLVTLASPTVPPPLLTMHVPPLGCVLTVTSYA